MKRFILSLLFAFFFATTFAQPKWDSTYRPDIYPHLVSQSMHHRQSENDIVFLGNSITFWGNWPELLNNSHVKNRGIPGDITFGVLERLPEIAAGKPARIFIMIGVNDLARNIPDSVILDNYRKMIRTIREKSPATHICFYTILPTNNSFGKLKSHYGKDTHIVSINASLKKLAQQEAVHLIDIYKSFAGADGRLKEAYTWDGVHLTADGYRLWADILKKEKLLD